MKTDFAMGESQRRKQKKGEAVRVAKKRKD